jgi:TIR domain
LSWKSGADKLPLCPEAAQPHFFISYTGADQVWVEWIAWQLEEAGYKVKIQAWDFSPGGNFVVEMQKATVECERTIAVFSRFLSEFAEAEWTAAFRLDPTGKNEKLIPVRIEDCQPPGPSPFTSGLWRSWKRPWARSTPTSQHAWKTTRPRYENGPSGGSSDAGSSGAGNSG